MRFKRAFRKHVQKRLGITKDKEIDKLLKNQATPQELAAFEKDGVDPKPRDAGPDGVYPLHMDTEDITHSPWNSAVGEALTVDFLQTWSTEGDLEGNDEEDCEESDESDVVDDTFLRPLWVDRLKNIKRELVHVARAANDPEYEVLVSKSARRLTHRNQVGVSR